MTGKSIKETHASDDTKAEQPGSISESKEEKGIKGSEAHKEQTGQLAEGEKHDHVKEEEAGTAKGGSETEKVDEKETKEETKSDEPTEKEIEASTEQALVRTSADTTPPRSWQNDLTEIQQLTFLSLPLWALWPTGV